MVESLELAVGSGHPSRCSRSARVHECSIAPDLGLSRRRVARHGLEHRYRRRLVQDLARLQCVQRGGGVALSVTRRDPTRGRQQVRGHEQVAALAATEDLKNVLCPRLRRYGRCQALGTAAADWHGHRDVGPILPSTVQKGLTLREEAPWL